MDKQEAKLLALKEEISELEKQISPDSPEQIVKEHEQLVRLVRSCSQPDKIYWLTHTHTHTLSKSKRTGPEAQSEAEAATLYGAFKLTRKSATKEAAMTIMRKIAALEACSLEDVMKRCGIDIVETETENKDKEEGRASED